MLLGKKYSRASSLNDLNDKEIADIFTETQAYRHERAKQLVSGAHLYQSLAAFEKPLVSKVTWEYIIPAKGPYAYIDLYGEPIIGGSRLKYLPNKRRARVLPYIDELPAQPLKKRRLAQTIFASWMAYSAFTAYQLSHNPKTDDAANHRNINSSIDMQTDSEQALYNFYYLLNLISPIIIYIVEGYRLGHRDTILALPSLYLLAAQSQGIALISPVYAILSAFLSSPLPTRRFVKLEVARAFIPALILGHVLPMVFIFSGLFGVAKFATSWAPRVYQFAPILACGLTFCFAHLGRIWNSKYETQRDREQSEFECYKAQDVPVLKSAYLFAFVLQAVAHITLLAYAHNELNTTLSQTVFRSYSVSNHKSMTQITELFSDDPTIAFTTWFISNIYSIWDLRCFGYIKTQDGLICVLSVVAGQILVGPGATWAGLWYWREGVIAGLQRN